MAKGITSIALAACLILAQGMPLSVAVKVEPSEVVRYYDSGRLGYIAGGCLG